MQDGGGWAGWVSSPPRGREPNAGGGQQVGPVATGCTRMRSASASPPRGIAAGLQAAARAATPSSSRGCTSWVASTSCQRGRRSGPMPCTPRQRGLQGQWAHRAAPHLRRAAPAVPWPDLTVGRAGPATLHSPDLR
eukprot:9435910-Alexandrium_andersonii.AAC.1